jgi:hypothetical protein
MSSVLHALTNAEGWFNRKFGWFFTNGSKNADSFTS